MSSSSYGRGPPEIKGMTSLKVDNLTYRTTPDDLRRNFDKYGEIGDIYIPRDRFTRESRGFAFIRYYDRRDAEDAMEAMDGRRVDGRELRVQMARYGRPDTPPYRRKRRRSRSRTPRSHSRSRGRRSRRSRSRSRSHSKERRRSSRSRSHSGSRRRTPSRSHSKSNGEGSKSRSRSRSASKSRSHTPVAREKENGVERQEIENNVSRSRSPE